MEATIARKSTPDHLKVPAFVPRPTENSSVNIVELSAPTAKAAADAAMSIIKKMEHAGLGDYPQFKPSAVKVSHNGTQSWSATVEYTHGSEKRAGLALADNSGNIVGVSFIGPNPIDPTRSENSSWAILVNDCSEKVIELPNVEVQSLEKAEVNLLAVELRHLANQLKRAWLHDV